MVNSRIDASGLGVFTDLQATGDTNLRAGISIGSIPAGFEYRLPQDGQTAEDGSQMKYDLASKSLQFFKPLNYSQAVTSSVINSATADTLISSGLGSVTYTGGTGQVGSAYKVEANGFLRTNGAAQTIRFIVNWGVNIVADSGVLILDTLPTLKNWNFTGEIVLKSVGAVGDAVEISNFGYNGSTAQYLQWMSTTSAPVGTDTSRNLDVSVQWGTANPDNQLFCQTLNIRQIS